MTHQDAMLLATLLLADGSLVPYSELPGRHGLRGLEGGPQNTRSARRKLRLAGLDGCVEWGRRSCRMVALPPDWALDDVLLAARQIRNEPASRGWTLAS